MPVGFRFDPETERVEIGGRWIAASRKWRNLQSNSAVAFVVDDAGDDGPRGIEIRGRAVLHADGSERFGRPGMDPEWLAILPGRIASWGIEAPAFSPGGRVSRRVDA